VQVQELVEWLGLVMEGQLNLLGIGNPAHGVSFAGVMTPQRDH
jgi:hypothetical protein